jgi:hypothetical protein
MEISIYSKLTDEQLSHLHTQYTAKYGKALFDETRPLEERKLAKLISESVNGDTQEQERERFSVCECLKEIIYRESKEIAELTYLAMKKRDDFGIPDEHKVTISFCRNIMNIPDDREVNYLDVDSFRRVLNECDRRNGCKSADVYMEYVKNYALDILGKKFPIADTDLFDELHQLINSDWYFWTTLSIPYGPRFALGVLDKREIDNNKVWVLLDEYARSPQLSLNIAAEVFRDTTIIRQESLNVIFLCKWLKYFDQSEAERRYDALRHVNSAIREGIKKMALSLYDAFNTEDVLKIKDIFIHDMVDGVIWHEMGHHVSYKDFDPVHFNFHYTINNNENSGSVLLEALADWAPQYGHKKGAFTRFLEVAQNDPKRAARDIWVYMSDCWFPDEKSEYMSLYSDVLIGLALYFINQDGTVDFKRIALEKDQIYAFLQERFRNLVERLLAMIRQSEYDFTIKNLNFCELEDKELKMHQESGKSKSLEELRKSNSFWENMVGYLEKFSKDGWKQYQNIMSEENKLLEQEILKMVAKDNQEEYRYSLRNYIVKRAKEIGIIDYQAFLWRFRPRYVDLIFP